MIRIRGENTLFRWFRVKSALPVALVVVAALPFLFFVAFSDIQVHDDQGTLMITFRQILDGGVLYRDMMALYGPFYYLIITPLFSIFNIPLSHDVTRLISVLFSIACSAVFTSLAWRLTRSAMATAYGFIISLFLLTFFTDSPLHPQELSFLLLGILLHLLFAIEKEPRPVLLLLVGGIAGGILLTKVNLAAFVVLPLMLAALRATSGQPWMRAAHRLVLILGLLAPVVLMAPLLHLEWSARYCLLASGTIAAALVVWSSSVVPKILTIRLWWVCFFGFAIVVLLTLGATMAAGTTALEIFHATVLQHFGLVRNWYIPASVTDGAIATTAISLAYAIYFARSRTGNREAAMQRITRLKAGIGILGFLSVALASFVGLPWEHLPPLMFQFLAPFAWLAMVPDETAEQPFPLARGVLGLMAAFLVLYAFPVAGGQVTLAGLLPAVMLPVLVNDAARAFRLQERFKDWKTSHGKSLSHRLVLLAPFALPLAMMSSQTVWALQYYRSLEPADFRGTSLVRTDKGSSELLHWAVSELSRCPAFFSLPSVSSLYFWADQRPPTGMLSNNTLALLSHEQQRQVISDLERQPELCVLKAPALLKYFDRGQVATKPPLLQYIDENFITVASRGPFQILRRNSN